MGAVNAAHLAGPGPWPDRVGELTELAEFLGRTNILSIDLPAPVEVPPVARVTGADRDEHHVVDLVCGRDFTSDGVIDYVVVDEPATLVWLANLAALELHTPQWTISSGMTNGLPSLSQIRRTSS